MSPEYNDQTSYGMKKPEVLAIIPARGGSKSIPRKNIKILSGIPLIAYSIAAGLKAKSVSRVIVSTDDEEIARIARKFGAEVPFMRPKELARDDTPDLPVFDHALKWLKESENYVPDVVVQLRPTSPFRPPDSVDRAVGILIKNKLADCVRAVVPSGQNPYKMWRIGDKGYLSPLLKVAGIAEPYNAPRQKLPLTYWQTGHVDVIRYKTIMNKGSMSGKRILPLILDPRYTVDIDTEADWVRAEWLTQQAGLDMVRPGPPKRPLPERVRLLALDFDGVLTDNRVWVDHNGVESVACSRGDGLGLAELRRAGIPVVVVSTETNPIVSHRCKKLGVPCLQGLERKAEVLASYLAQKRIDPKSVVFCGNDTNDLGCFDLVGVAVAVADSHPEVIRRADLVLRHRGGKGAVRELCDILIRQVEAQDSNDVGD